MAGGTWVSQNKVRPGVYINFESEPKALGTIGERGTITMPISLSWGPAKEVITIQAGQDVRDILGYDITAPQVLLIKEALKRAKTLRLYRLNTGTKASVTLGTVTATAKYGGLRGNDVTIVIQNNIDASDKFDVITLVENVEVDRQLVATVAELQRNAWVEFSGTGELQVTSGAPLTGGDDGTVVNQDHTDYLKDIEVYEFDTMALPSDDPTLRSVYVSFVQRLREDEGRKVQVVIANYPHADYEGVISVKNGVILADGTEIDAVKATAWVAGATAGAQVNQSLTYTAYDDAIDVDLRFTHQQIVEALKAGEFLFIPKNGKAIVEQDINTFTSFTPKKRKHFSKNRVIRTLDGLANDYQRIFDTYYLGKADNNEDWRDLFHNECVNISNLYQEMNAINHFTAEDIAVFEGAERDSVVIRQQVQPVDSAEKFYFGITVK